VQVVSMLICVAFCVDRHKARRLWAAPVAVRDLSRRDCSDWRHSPLICVVHKERVRPAQTLYSQSHLRVSDQ